MCKVQDYERKSTEGLLPSLRLRGRCAGTTGAKKLEAMDMGICGLPEDVMTSLCLMLDVEALIRVASTCKHLHAVGFGDFPWRQLCMQRWGLAEGGGGQGEEGASRKQGRSDHPRNAPLPLTFYESILGTNFRSVYPLIEDFPRGFDCDALDQATPSPQGNAIATNAAAAAAGTGAGAGAVGVAAGVEAMAGPVIAAGV
ncbi:unnamed protein product, partial [Discosporangium mesarthrocarpum]